MSLNVPPKSSRSETSPPGVISAGTLYTAAEVRTRLRLGTWAWRQLRRQGLPVFTVGRNSYVLGDDVIAFFRNVEINTAKCQ